MAVARLFFLLLLLLVLFTLAACREDGDVKIAHLHFNGVHQVNQTALKGALQTKAGSWIPWGHKTFFDRRAFDADLKRIEAFYRDRGFSDARVTSFDVKLNDAQDEVSVTVTVAEGEPTRVAAIDFTGFDVLSEGDQRKLRDSVLLRVDWPLDQQLVMTAREHALNELRDHGYPYAEVTVNQVEESARRQRVVFSANPGTLAHFGPVGVAGEASVGEKVILRQLTFKPGDLFTRREMRESQRKLYGMELFEFVNVESREMLAPQSPEVPVRVTVAEGKHRKVNVGVGYGTEEQARARLRWDHLNFLGNARQAGLEGKWSSLDRGVRADYREPFFFQPHFSLTVDGQAWQAAEPVYALNSVGGRATIRHQANSENFWSVALFNEYQRSNVTGEALLDLSLRDELIALGLDPRTGQSRGTASGVAFDIGRNTTTNLLDAHSGYVLNGHVEQTGKWLMGSFNYWSVGVDGRHYLTVARRLVLANRLRLGTIDALGDLERNVPFYKRYFLGGSSSLRGWGRFEVGPTSGFGLPIGGHTVLEGSTEVRLPLWNKFGVVAFADYGNVWSQSWDFNPADLRYDVGPGLRYLTPIGPARIDLGYQMTPISGLRVNGQPELRHWRLHFSIGQAF